MNNLRNADIIKNIKKQRLSEVCALGTGGEAEIFIEPDTPEEFQEILVAAQGNRVYILGGGSNVVFPDGLVEGVVLSTRALKKIRWLEDSRVEVQAGYSLPKLFREVREHDLGGLEFAVGIPGTVGGAICGNAGAAGFGICDLLEEVTTIESDGNLRIWRKNDFAYSYRYCELANDARIIISCVMRFREKSPDDDSMIKNFADKRRNQPLEFRSAGCTFKNPESQSDKSAGKLLDECGCKGLGIGGAVVSGKHANFILNVAGASSADVFQLVRICRERVLSETGISLEPEIKFVGFDDAP